MDGRDGPEEKPVDEDRWNAGWSARSGSADEPDAGRPPARSSVRAPAGEQGGGDDAPPGSASRPPPVGSALIRAIQILDVVARAPERPSLAEICRVVRLPKATVFRILGTLEHAGLIGREPGARRYESGQRLHEMALHVLRHSPANAARHAILEELVEQIGETCNLVVPDHQHIRYLDRVEAAWPLRVSFKPGSLVPLCASASGKLFLGMMGRRARERFVRSAPLVGFTPNTLTEPDRLMDELEAIRRRGWSSDNEEYLTGICCLAVPVRNRRGEVVAAVAAQGPSARMRVDLARELLPQLHDAAQRIGQTFDGTD